MEKVLAFEASGQDLLGDAVLVADNADLAGNFESDADEIAAGVLATRPVSKVYLGLLGAATRSSIVSAFDQGASLMSYVGHGGTAVWASENVFNNADVATLSGPAAAAAADDDELPERLLPLPAVELAGGGAREGAGEGSDRGVLAERSEPQRRRARVPHRRC